MTNDCLFSLLFHWLFSSSATSIGILRSFFPIAQRFYMAWNCSEHTRWLILLFFYIEKNNNALKKSMRSVFILKKYIFFPITHTWRVWFYFLLVLVDHFKLRSILRWMSICVTNILFFSLLLNIWNILF
jgi:hypothetical protein